MSTICQDLRKTWLAAASLLTLWQKIRRGGKNTQKNNTKKELHDPDNHDGVITHLEPRGGDGIPVELFQIQKMML